MLLALVELNHPSLECYSLVVPHISALVPVCEVLPPHLKFCAYTLAIEQVATIHDGGVLLRLCAPLRFFYSHRWMFRHLGLLRFEVLWSHQEEPNHALVINVPANCVALGKYLVEVINNLHGATQFN